jgi:CRISPR-associated endoribonuclease Cas6
MRIKLNLKTSKNTLIPINNQHVVNSYIHRCLGKNNIYHDKKSDYCISNIRGGKLNDDKTSLVFNDGAYIIITSDNNDFIISLLNGINDNPEFGYGMLINGFDFINEEIHDNINIFRTLTPILLKEKINNNTYKFITIKDECFESYLKNYLINKLTKIDKNINLNNFDVIIKKHYTNKTKLIMVKNVKNIGSYCDVIIKSNKKVAEMIYNYGIGQSTGSGFGTIYKSKNHKLYFNYN